MKSFLQQMKIMNEQMEHQRKTIESLQQQIQQQQTKTIHTEEDNDPFIQFKNEQEQTKKKKHDIYQSYQRKMKEISHERNKIIMMNNSEGNVICSLTL